MTLDEAIRYEEKAAEEFDELRRIKAVTLEECKRANEHVQLANWLKELKQLREKESKDELKDLSKRVENIEKQMKKDKEEQLKKLQAEIEYAKFCCALEEERNNEIQSRTNF